MIGRLRGRVLERDLGRLVVDTGGVGYDVSVPLSCLERLGGDEVDLYIHTEVRSDAIQLFGFLSRQERDLFRKLISVQGVGPSTALAILSGMSAESLAAAVAARDFRRLQGIPRVGKKTAERICLELAEKIGAASAGTPEASLPSDLTDALSALVNLGYRPKEASEALRQAREALPAGPVPALIRLALKNLSPR